MSTSCIHCGSSYLRVVKRKIANGTHQLFLQCQDCQRNANGSGHYLSQKNIDLEDYPTVADYTSPLYPCVVCGTHETEIHHWAPRSKFGDEADLWPTSPLCRECHAKWHLLVEGIKI